MMGYLPLGKSVLVRVRRCPEGACVLEFVHCHCVRCLMAVGVGDNDSSCSGDCRCFNGRVPGTGVLVPVLQ